MNKTQRNYTFVLLALIYSTSPFFSLVTLTFWVILFALFGFYAINKTEFNLKLVLFTGLAYSLICIQAYLFGGFSPASLYKPVLIFITPYILYRILGMQFFTILFNIIYFWSLITIPFWVLQNIAPTFFNELANILYPYTWDVEPRSLLIYTVEPYFELTATSFLSRNSGFFHEPGAFSIYLMMGIFLNGCLTKKLFHKKTIILACILITTFSTAGFIILTIYIIYAMFVQKIHSLAKLALVIMTVLLTVYSFQNFKFLHNKLEANYSDQMYHYKTGNVNSRGRFFAFVQSADFIMQNPLIGRGIIEKNNYPVIREEAAIGYGFMGVFMKYGLLFGVVYLVYFYRGFKKLVLYHKQSLSYAIVFFIILNLGLLTQDFYYNISFVYFFIVGLIFKQMPNNHTDVQTK